MPNQILFPATSPSGTPVAQPYYLVDIYGNPISSTNAQSVTVANANPNGQTTMANSAPVVLASDQVHPANVDGLTPSQLLANGAYLYSSGGPVDSTGKPQLAAWDRAASWQGKAQAGASTNITSTTAGDTNLTFSAAPKTIMPGQKIQLSVGASATPVETVIVAANYAVSSTATVIPLQYPVVNSGSTTAKWDVYAPGGPGSLAMLSNDLPVTVLAGYSGNNQALFSLLTASLDAQAPNAVLEFVPGLATTSGGSVDRQRGNTDNTLLASAARTTTQTSADLVNYNGRGIIVTLDMTVVGTGSVTLAINGKDTASGKYFLLLSGVAVVTNITSVYTIYPGIAAVANVSANGVLPRTFQIVVTANNANSATYSVGYSTLL